MSKTDELAYLNECLRTETELRIKMSKERAELATCLRQVIERGDFYHPSGCNSTMAAMRAMNKLTTENSDCTCGLDELFRRAMDALGGSRS